PACPRYLRAIDRPLDRSLVGPVARLRASPRPPGFGPIPRRDHRRETRTCQAETGKAGSGETCVKIRGEILVGQEAAYGEVGSSQEARAEEKGRGCQI